MTHDYCERIWNGALLQFDALEATALPQIEAVRSRWGDLRSYQQDGVAFLGSRESALLADEMGLGKTVMTAVAIRVAMSRPQFRRALIVCPTALVTNWEEELRHWLGDVQPRAVRGPRADREAAYDLPLRVLIASYEHVRLDFPYIFRNAFFDLVVLDEAQRIRNPNSQTAHACLSLPRHRSWALTGTPIENRPEDLVAVLGFVKRGLLASGATVEEAHAAIQPYFLRRRKSDVLPELPPIIDQTIPLDLDGPQHTSYNEAQSRGGVSSSSPASELLALITRLKQICNFDPETGSSVKADLVVSILNECAENNHKVLIFSQYVESLRELSKRSRMPATLYHGGLDRRSRDDAIRLFKQSPKARVLLMSLMAGGVGLNLPEADVVIMFDRWWNPAAEQQAIERAHRFGREGSLVVYRLLVRDTIEQRIAEILEDKKAIFGDWIEGAPPAETTLDRQTLQSILHLSVS